MSITVGGEYSLTATLLLSLYPQAYFPQLCIIATADSVTVNADGSVVFRFKNRSGVEF